ncbi:Asp-tRNA(Asn)/Glu-tRNA(Gln) amidotransferase subunit GatB [Sulfobacillus thermosulfidooxidans]|uniref:Asp-tRNA(Asn)/Glu-tRNA(Gln) amidotransferase subunit GatB n=1 Tax=Sulfobacillus thermosulfidooxidans TaxID=28034 RepID=UPI00096B861A|nr:Asp-tRNA(Asn)/Glu-tRNA(Gln) amidotransferase subunit GatB [Sulfobacillus thermosulfidooxidans]OLZ09957.1 glutaminyl-tRNA synthase (glutamine-hydrolyzing) subunit B [Sulfobacillus thermosulfidooxidans]OLZ15738.1 glutaminyl-tRNA synthase (glutamine-hydrolyzing) subunit B [Sulfobacillus thermosulfidooxidans]OLZ18415.1 glutaminyl-tRNA synthase (glutamine-hydrolyzing) subunit B [Sulfobacillus thermosulfidooxidans]
MNSNFEVIIGLEVHVELKTQSKLFCSCSTEFGAEPNTHTCSICLGMPGVLPVLNQQAVVYATKAAMALQCTVHPYSKFDRKQYFYPDLPKAYQISQYDQPLAEHGSVPIVENGEVVKKIGVRRIHLEEDAGKLNHIGQRLGDAKGSLVDLNRAGVPLIEIVSEPDIRSAEEARLYLTELRNILSYLDISDLRMEEGSMRCDANVSLRPKDYTGSLEDLPRVEIKNVNSIRNVQRGIEYEVERQAELLARGERIVKETRGFDDQSGRTYSQRSKEEANDYRYFPEPDLPPLVLDEAFIQTIAGSLPPSTMTIREELKAAGVQPKDIEIILADQGAWAFWQDATSQYGDARQITNWMLSDLSRLLNAHGDSFATSPVSPSNLVELLKLIDDGTLSGRMAKEVLDHMYQTKQPAHIVVKDLGLSQITDQNAITQVVEETVAQHPQVVQDYLSGKEKALGFLVGQVMKKTKGQAKPDMVNAILKEVIQAYAEKA